nr:MAG TPA: hypothetical protein [Caudoviricetes sp.]
MHHFKELVPTLHVSLLHQSRSKSIRPIKNRALYSLEPNTPKTK